jgi:hypothetical protein
MTVLNLGPRSGALPGVQNLLMAKFPLPSASIARTLSFVAGFFHPRNDAKPLKRPPSPPLFVLVGSFLVDAWPHEEPELLSDDPDDPDLPPVSQPNSDDAPVLDFASEELDFASEELDFASEEPDFVSDDDPDFEPEPVNQPKSDPVEPELEELDELDVLEELEDPAPNDGANLVFVYSMWKTGFVRKKSV